jgi:hypothetical protein
VTGESIEPNCPVCDNRFPEKCDECHGAGKFSTNGKPSDFVTPDVWELLEAASLVKETGWPRGRGWACEPMALVDGVRRVWRELDEIKAELMKAPNG